MLPTKVFFTSGTGTHLLGDKLARDEASRGAGVATLNLATVSSILAPGIEIIDRARFESLIKPGQVVFCINGTCETTEPGQRVTAGLAWALPTGGAATGFVSELYEQSGLDPDHCRRRVEQMALQLVARDQGIEDWSFAMKNWKPYEADYRVGELDVEVGSLVSSIVCPADGPYTCAAVFAVLLP